MCNCKYRIRFTELFKHLDTFRDIYRSRVLENYINGYFKDKHFIKCYKGKLIKIICFESNGGPIKHWRYY